MTKLKGSGGTEGGLWMFFIGCGLCLLAVYFFFDSVRVMTGQGVMGRMLQAAGRGGGWMETSSTGLLFVPFLLAIIALFYDAAQRWAWWLLYGGIAILAIEVLSRVRFVLNTKLTYLLLLLALFGAGVGLILRSYRDQSKTPNPEEAQADPKETPTSEDRPG